MAIESMETLIPNTTMQKFINSQGRHTMYRITPNEGYVLHDRRIDFFEEIDEETGYGIGEPITLRYSEGTITVSVNYDFDNVVAGIDGNTPVNKVGAFEIYAILRSDVPEDNICEVEGPPAEIA